MENCSLEKITKRQFVVKCQPDYLMKSVVNYHLIVQYVYYVQLNREMPWLERKNYF